jgi:NAD(P)-dependent dehydrogenase (short-subunit alcohol dehydrogenase family)
MMRSFANRVVLVTGAGSGLGRQLSLLLVNEGAFVGGIDLHPEPLAKLAAELPDKQFAWSVADVNDRVILSKAVSHLSGQLGPMDMLIASAGIGVENSALAFRAEEFEAQVRVNLIGVANSVEAVLSGMIERRRGQIVALSSLASYRGLPKMLAYCASKAGLNAFLDGLRVELKPLGITVTTICPGWIRTPMTARIAVPTSGMMEVQEAATRILEAIRQGRSFYAFPPSTTWRVRLLRWLPCGVSDWLTHRALTAATGAARREGERPE